MFDNLVRTRLLIGQRACTGFPDSWFSVYIQLLKTHTHTQSEKELEIRHTEWQKADYLFLRWDGYRVAFSDLQWSGRSEEKSTATQSTPRANRWKAARQTKYLVSVCPSCGWCLSSPPVLASHPWVAWTIPGLEQGPAETSKTQFNTAKVVPTLLWQRQQYE